MSNIQSKTKISVSLVSAVYENSELLYTDTLYLGDDVEAALSEGDEYKKENKGIKNGTTCYLTLEIWGNGTHLITLACTHETFWTLEKKQTESLSDLILQKEQELDLLYKQKSQIEKGLNLVPDRITSSIRY